MKSSAKNGVDTVEAVLSRKVRDIPDFPKKGIVFKDITPILSDPTALQMSVDAICKRFSGEKPELVIGAEARGFIFAPAIALNLGAGFVPIRKPGKLPYRTRRVSYELEYGTDSLEIHEDAVRKGQRCLLIDDLLATGGTMEACCKMVESLGGEVVGCAFLIELAFLPGRKRLKGYDVFSLLQYDKE